MCADENASFRFLFKQQHCRLGERFRLSGSERSVDDERREEGATPFRHDVLHDRQLLLVQL